MTDAGRTTAASTTTYARAAAAVSACWAGYDVNRFFRHAVDEVDVRDSSPLRNPSVLQCLANVSDGCAGVQRCTGLVDAPYDGCESRCEGDVAHQCSSEYGLHRTINCAVAGMTCLNANCVPRSPVACNEETFEPRCDGSQPVQCLNDIEVRGSACDEFGLTCVVGASGAECVGPGAACTETSGEDHGILEYEYATRCASSSKVGLCVEGRTAEVACPPISGATCMDTAAGSVCVAGSDSECAGGASYGGCTSDGDTMIVCVAGAREEVRCTSMGFAGCNEDGACVPNARP